MTYNVFLLIIFWVINVTLSSSMSLSTNSNSFGVFRLIDRLGKTATYDDLASYLNQNVSQKIGKTCVVNDDCDEEGVSVRKRVIGCVDCVPGGSRFINAVLGTLFHKEEPGIKCIEPTCAQLMDIVTLF